MNTPSSPTRRKTGSFLKELMALKENQGRMAELRYLLIPSLCHRGWQAVASIGGLYSPARMLIAGLFALHPHHDATLRNFGSSCCRLANRNKKNAEDKETAPSPLDIRFRRLLDADFEELKHILPNLIRRLQNENIPVNYVQLYKDLHSWDRSWKNDLLCRWAQEYWNPNTQPSSDHDAPVSE